MLLYYTEMVKAIDLVKEDARLSKVNFRREAAARAVETPPPPPPAPMTGAAKTLEDAERLYTARDLAQADKLFLDALRQTDRKPQQAAAYYGLARIAALENQPETAERLFQKTLEMEPEPPVKAWALVYLGKLSLAAGDREQAVRHFQNALQVEGASEKARAEAQKGVEQSSKP